MPGIKEVVKSFPELVSLTSALSLSLSLGLSISFTAQVLNSSVDSRNLSTSLQKRKGTKRGWVGKGQKTGGGSKVQKSKGKLQKCHPGFNYCSFFLIRQAGRGSTTDPRQKRTARWELWRTLRQRYLGCLGTPHSKVRGGELMCTPPSSLPTHLHHTLKPSLLIPHPSSLTHPIRAIPIPIPIPIQSNPILSCLSTMTSQPAPHSCPLSPRLPPVCRCSARKLQAQTEPRTAQMQAPPSQVDGLKCPGPYGGPTSAPVLFFSYP